MSSWVVSCEHAGHEVPAPFARYFASAEARRALQSHRGWDPGTAVVGARIAELLEVPLHIQRVSRLLVECNRSEDHPRLFSEFSGRMSSGERSDALDRFWRPHRAAVREGVVAAPEGTLVVHLGVHSFTPVYRGRRRPTDVGFLFDPRREPEATIARLWRREAVRRLKNLGWRFHLNLPYRGWSDGLTTTLRGEFPPDRYAGLELEISQGHMPLDDAITLALVRALERAVAATIG